MKTLERQLAEYCGCQEELHGPITADELVARGSLAAPVDSATDLAQSEICDQCGADLTVFDLREPAERSSAAPQNRVLVLIGAAAAVLAVFFVLPIGDGATNDRDTVTGDLAESDQPDAAEDPAEPVSEVTEEPDAPFRPFLATLATPNDVEFDPSGGLFVSETDGRRVVRVGILPDGSAGESVVVASGIADAEGLAFDDSGVLYISSSTVVYRVEDGLTTRFVGGFRDPEGLAIDATGDLYVADDAELGIRITRVTVRGDGSAGTSSEILVIPGGSASDIEFGPTGELFVANRLDEVWVVTFTNDGSATSRPYARVPGGPAALAFDSAGTLYVGTDNGGGGAVWSINAAGVPAMITAASSHVEGLAIGASGTLYLSNVGANEVLRISADDLISPPRVAGAVLSPDVVDLVSRDGWVRVPHDETVFGGGAMNGVAVGGPGFVAVGGEGSFTAGEGGERDTQGYDAAVWTSVDGLTWSRVPRDEAVFGGSWVRSVTAGGPGLVAVGSAAGGRDENTVGTAWTEDGVIWTSVDGFIWSRVPHDDAVFGGSWIMSVTAGGPGLVAVGFTEGHDSPDENEDLDAVVWTSVDGLIWSRVPHDEAVLGGKDNQAMSDVTVGGPGLVAVGWDGVGEPGHSTSLDAAVWTSVDGLTWSRVPQDEDVFGGFDAVSMTAVTAGGPGLVAVGGNIIGSVVWTSVDGITWSEVSYDFVGRTNAVVAGGPGVVVVGEGAGEAVVWTSTDGVTWSRLQPDGRVPGLAGMAAVLEIETGLIAVGGQESLGDTDAAVWLWEPED